jgi:hypothetical protein
VLSVDRFFAILVGIVYAIVLVYLGIVLAGAGHGWILAGFVSFASLLLIPFAAVGWASRRLWLGLIVFAIAGLCDLLLFMTAVGRNSDLARSYTAVPVYVLSWAALWLLWQTALLIWLLRGTLRT